MDEGANGGLADLLMCGGFRRSTGTVVAIAVLASDPGLSDGVDAEDTAVVLRPSRGPPALLRPLPVGEGGAEAGLVGPRPVGITPPKRGPQRLQVQAVAAFSRAEVRELGEDVPVPPPPDRSSDFAADDCGRVEEKVKLPTLVRDEARGGLHGPIEPPGRRYHGSAGAPPARGAKGS